ncbi:MAG: hypothetical protein N3A66_08370, partial [Planctomycetota bacterium]|nr:hypothetical protein [Planctomycetota bacterium]
AANTVIANAATAAPAEGVSVEQTPQEKSVVPDWEKEEIRQPIAGAYAVVYVSRRFLGLCLAGKYIRRYKQIGVNLPGGLPVEKIVGHWRVADQEGEAGAGQLRLVPATVAADSPREMLICGHGQTTDLVALFLEPEQVEEIARALPAAAWVVIQP